MKILGIDLGKFNSVACLLDTETYETLFFSFKSFRQEFKSLLAQSLPNLVVIEACTISGWVHDLCQAEQFEVLVANTNQQAWCWKHVKRKTDKDDALKLAKLASLGQIDRVYMPSSESRQYRQLVKYRKQLISRTTRIQNTIRALFSQQGIVIRSGAQAWTIAGIEHLSQYRKPMQECDSTSLWQGQIGIELDLLDHLWEEQHLLEKKLTQIAKQDSRVQLLETIPGVGRVTAEIVVAFIDDPNRFENARQVSAYAGLIPRQHQSGALNRMGRITKRGPKVLRTALVEASWLMIRYNSWAAAFYQRICGGQKTRKKQAIIALARKLLVRCWTLLRKKEKWDDQKAIAAAI